jgi:hypothetical protein
MKAKKTVYFFVDATFDAVFGVVGALFFSVLLLFLYLAAPKPKKQTETTTHA